MKHQKAKTFMAACGIMILGAGNTFGAVAGWNQTEKGWVYVTQDNQYRASQWFQDVDGRWYHFNAEGVMETGWFRDGDGKWYFLDQMSGAMKTGWYLDNDNKWYFLSYDGSMQTGLIEVNDQVYFMGESGALFVGDMVIDGKSYHFTEYGTTNGKPYVPQTQKYSGNGNQTVTESHSSGSVKHVADYVQESVAQAVGEAAGDEHISQASISGRSITVTPVAGDSLIDGLGAADAVFGAFADSEYVIRVDIAGNGGSANLYDGESYSLTRAAKALGFSGSDQFASTKGTYSVTVSYRGTIRGTEESGSLVYTVTVK